MIRVVRLGRDRPTLVVRPWPPAVRVTWPVLTRRRWGGGRFGLGQDTTQVGFAWPPGPRWPRWRELRDRGPGGMGPADDGWTGEA